MFPDWYISLGDFPDSTTQEILNLDAKLESIERVLEDGLCLICGKSGIHAHWTE